MAICWSSAFKPIHRSAWCVYSSPTSNCKAGLKGLPHVEDIVGIPGAVMLQKDSLAEKLNAVRIFPDVINDQTVMDSCRLVFLNCPLPVCSV